MSFKVQSILGMNNYLQMFGDQLFEQNKRSLLYLKSGLSSFYGKDDFIGHLGSLGSDAIQRSTINEQRTTTHITGITEVGNVSYFSTTS